MSPPPTPRTPRWRVGRKVGRTLYLQLGDQPSDNDALIGLMDSRALALLVVTAVNAIYRGVPLPPSDPDPDPAG